MKRKRFRTLRALCLIVMVVCLIQIGREYILSARNEARQAELKSMLENADGGQAQDDAVTDQSVDGANGRQTGRAEEKSGQTNSVENLSDDRTVQETEADLPAEKEEKKTCDSGIPGEEGGKLILEKYKTLYMENGDVAGWLAVDGTKIDYPVMQCEDDEYYLHHDFDGNDSKYGCLFVREKADLEEGTNFVIYGHNMRDGSMFGELDLYLEEEFYREHPKISFDSLYEAYSYEIVAVFRSRIYGEKDEVFKYYQFYEAETRKDFDDFYGNIKELSLYDTGVTAKFGDKFLTLSTCAYHVKDGRLAVVAKRIE